MSDSTDAKMFDLAEAFSKRQEKLRVDLGLGDIASHPGTKGDETELNWLRMLKVMLPRRYGVTKAFVIDSQGQQSDQIDLVIHDRHFSPLLFEVGGADYIPAESVYAVFEVKQEINRAHLDYAAKKIASVRRLHRTSVDVPHAGGVYAPVPPKRIIGGILTRRSAWHPPFGGSFVAAVTEGHQVDQDGMDGGIDIGCVVESGGYLVTAATDDAVVAEHSDPSTALIYFVMRLLRLLQVLGSAPAIDYDAYLTAVPGTPNPRSGGPRHRQRTEASAED